MTGKILEAISRQANCKFIYRYYSATQQRRMELFKQGKIDILIGASKTPEREAFSYFSTSYRLQTSSIFSLEDHKITSYADILKHRQRLLFKGGWWGKDFEENRSRLKVADLLFEVSTLEKQIQLLKMKRGDLVLADHFAFVHTAKKIGLNSYKINFSTQAEPVHFMFSKTSVTKETFEKIDNALKELIDNGQVQTIIESYL